MRISISRYAAAVIGAGVLALTMSPAHAQTTSLVYWSFNDVPNGTTDVNQAVRDAFFNPDGGVNQATADMTTNFNFLNGNNGSAIGITTFNGDVTNGTLPNGNNLSAGQALTLQGAAGATVNNNGHYLEFGVSTIGFEDIVVSYATRGTSTGFNAVQFQYATNGIDFVNFGSAYNGRPTNWSTQTFDLSSIAGLEDNADARFRIVFDGASSTTGNNRIDNLQINAQPGAAAAVPEVGTVALMGMGALPLLGIIARRKRTTA